MDDLVAENGDQDLLSNLGRQAREDGVGPHGGGGGLEWQQASGVEAVGTQTGVACHNNSSNRELSEAINPMFRWYGESEICDIHRKLCSVFWTLGRMHRLASCDWRWAEVLHMETRKPGL